MKEGLTLAVPTFNLKNNSDRNELKLNYKFNLFYFVQCFGHIYRIVFCFCGGPGDPHLVNTKNGYSFSSELGKDYVAEASPQMFVLPEPAWCRCHYVAPKRAPHSRCRAEQSQSEAG